MKLLIPGGAGYIGSQMVKYAQEQLTEIASMMKNDYGNYLMTLLGAAR